MDLNALMSTEQDETLEEISGSDVLESSNLIPNDVRAFSQLR